MNELKNFINKFTSKTLFEQKDVVGIGDDLYLASPEIKRYFEKIRQKPHCLGLFLGRACKNQLMPSSALLQMISEHSDKKIIVDKKTEWLFVCGRDVFSKGIVKTGNVKQNDLVLVLNQHEECLGFGKLVNKNGSYLKNIFDIGSFLRRERRL